MTIDDAKAHIGWPVKLNDNINSDISNKALLTNMGVSSDGSVTIVDIDRNKYIVSCEDIELAKEQVKSTTFQKPSRTIGIMMGKVREFITRDQFNRLHKVCPACGNDQLRITLIGYIQKVGRDYEDHNKVWCEKDSQGCGWKGTCMDLIPSKNDIKNKQNV